MARPASSIELGAYFHFALSDPAFSYQLIEKKKNMHIVLLFFIIYFKVKSIGNAQLVHRIVVWNVGQGQWVTEITPDHCRHFDVGGEFGTFSRIRKSLLLHCALKKNEIRISHWDYDHFMNLPSLARLMPQLCYIYLPQVGLAKKAVKKVIALNLKRCPASAQLGSSVAHWMPPSETGQTKQTNKASAVFKSGPFLIPGDSPISAERKWITELDLQSVKYLVAGHHGSRTSSGDELLMHLSRLSLVLISARQNKYGHPHREVLERFKMKKTPVLKTEDWGHIWISLY